MMDAPVVLFFAGLKGLALGSFLNVCVARWPRGASVARPRSACPACAAAIRWHDLIPVASWLALGARCRACGARISLSYPLVEVAAAAICVLVVLTGGVSAEAAAAGFFLLALLGIALTDARFYLIPDRFSLGGAAVGLGFAFAPGGITPADAALGAVAGFGGMWLAGAAGTWMLARANPGRLEAAAREHDQGRRRARQAPVARLLGRPRGQMAAVAPAAAAVLLAGREYGPVGAAAAVAGYAGALAVLVAWVEGLGEGPTRPDGPKPSTRASGAPPPAHTPAAPAHPAARPPPPVPGGPFAADTPLSPQSVLGGGDVKMMALVGAFTGPWGAVLTVFVAALAGILAYYALRLLLGVRQLVPFGVFLAVGAAVTLWWGEALLEGYLRLAGLAPS